MNQENSVVELALVEIEELENKIAPDDPVMIIEL